jgi:hypothetical protein
MLCTRVSVLWIMFSNSAGTCLKCLLISLHCFWCMRSCFFNFKHSLHWGASSLDNRTDSMLHRAGCKGGFRKVSISKLFRRSTRSLSCSRMTDSSCWSRSFSSLSSTDIRASALASSGEVITPLELTLHNATILKRPITLYFFDNALFVFS